MAEPLQCCQRHDAHLVSDVQRRAYECAQAGNPIAQGLESSDAAARAKAVAQWEARLAREATAGEVASCG